MSGSPVYIDGRLIGAVSYSIGAFPKEADRRHHADRRDEGRDADAAARRRRSRPASSCRSRAKAWRPRSAHASARLAPFADRPADVQAIGLPAAAGAQLGAMLRPISTPLVMSGFEPDTVDLLAGAFRRRRLHAGRRRRHVGRTDAAPSRRVRSAKATRSASRSSAAISRWARPARSRTSTAIASTRSAIRSSTSGRRSSR